MRVVVFARHVPDSRLPVRVKADGSGIEAAGLKHVCDPFDEIGIEQAVQLKASWGDVEGDVEEIVAITIGGAGAADALRHALAMGADRAVHVVCDDLAHYEELRMARLFAGAVQKVAADADLVLCGARSTDNGAGEFGPAAAEFLDLPHAGAVTRLEVLLEEGNRARAACRVEGGEFVFEVSLPAVLTCERGLVEPKHPALPKLMKAKKQPIETLDAAELEGGSVQETALVQLTPPASRQACTMIDGEPAHMAKELVRLLREEAKVL